MAVFTFQQYLKIYTCNEINYWILADLQCDSAMWRIVSLTPALTLYTCINLTVRVYKE